MQNPISTKSDSTIDQSNENESRDPAPVFKVMIAEDEILIAEDLARLITNSGASAIGPYQDASDAIKALETERPDLAFVDAHLQDGTSFVLADRLNGMGIPLTFLTGDPEGVRKMKYSNNIIEKPFHRRAIEAELLAHQFGRH